MRDADWRSVAEALSDLDFPATKQQVVEHVRQKDVPEPVQRLLRGMPVGTYQNISEIRSSAPPRPDVDEHLSDSAQARQARERHTRHGRRIAEHLRDVS
jgi:hypothetical protein